MRKVASMSLIEFAAWLGLDRLRPGRAGLDQARPDLAGWIGLDQAHAGWSGLARVQSAWVVSASALDPVGRISSARIGLDGAETGRAEQAGVGVRLGRVGPSWVVFDRIGLGRFGSERVVSA